MRKTLKNLILKTLAGLAVLTMGMIVSAHAGAVDVNLIIKPLHNVAPDSITNLTAIKSNYTAGGAEGRIDLSWTAPQTLWDIDVLGYYIGWSTSSLAELGNDTTAWWNKTISDNTWLGDLTYFNSPGDAVNRTMGSLTPMATYYFGVKAEDEFGNVSAIDLMTGSGNQPYAMASWDNIAPGTINNLSALTGGGTGEIDLSWTAPGDDGNTGNITGGKYRIKWSTASESDWDIGSWNDWENRCSLELSTDTVYGELNRITVTGLNNYTTYYFKVWTRDERLNWSGESNDASARTRSQMQMSPITDLAAVSDNSTDGKVNLSWTSMGGAAYIIKYDERSVGELGGSTVTWWNTASNTYPQGMQPKNPGELEEIFGLAGLTAGTTYYFSVRAMEVDGSSTPVGNVAYAIAGDTVPAAPEGLALEIINNKVNVSWSKNNEPDIYNYRIYRKKGSGSYTNIYTILHADIAGATAQYEDGGVALDGTYTYYIEVIDNTGHSAVSVEEEINTASSEVYADIDVIRIAGYTDTNLTFVWEQVAGNIKGYRIERTNDLSGAWTDEGFVCSTHTLTYTVTREGTVYYYRIRTESWAGTRSQGALSIDTSIEINHIYMSEDGNAWAMVPYQCAQELYPENNSGEAVKIILDKEENNEFILSYNIKAVSGSETNNNFVFTQTRKGPKIVISYKQLLQSKAISYAPGDTRKLALYWHNGVEWIKLGGISEDALGRVYTSSRRLGKYAIKFADFADKFTLTKVVPRIFTPEEGDYRINVVRFYFENPNFEEVTIKIFDVTGAQVRGTLRREGENVMIWDGRDDNGSVVRGGAYIYQIEAEGKILNGTIVVAK